MGLIGGPYGSNSWVRLWDGHVGVFGGGARPALLLFIFLIIFFNLFYFSFGLPPEIPKRVMVSSKHTR